MPNFTASDVFSNVELLETTEQVLGGANTAPSNKQAQALVNRTEWLKKRVSGMEVLNKILPAMTNLSFNSNAIGKFAIVTSDTPNSLRDFNIVLPTGITNGNQIVILLSDSDNRLLIGTRGGIKYYNGDLIQFIWDGTVWIPNLLHRSLTMAMYSSSTYSTGTGKQGIQLESINSKFYVNNSVTSRVTNIQFQGTNFPNNGYEIAILNQSATTWEITDEGNIILDSIGVTYNSHSYKSYFIKAGEYLRLVYNNTLANKWEFLDYDISEKSLQGINSKGTVALESDKYPSLQNWINKLIEKTSDQEFVFKGTGVGVLSNSLPINWNDRLVRFGFDSVYNPYGSALFINPNPAGVSTPSQVSMPTYGSGSYYQQIKEYNLFLLPKGDYSIDIKFKVKNTSITTTTITFSLMHKENLLNNYNTIDGTSQCEVTLIITPGLDDDVHLYATRCPINIDSPSSDIDQYIWVEGFEDISGSLEYQLSNCEVTIKAEKL